MLLEIVTLARLGHAANAASPRVVTLFGMVTLTRLLQPWKA